MSDDLVFSIDPGLTSVGVCLFDARENKVLYADKLSLAPSLKDFKKSGEHTIVQRVYKLFFYEESPIKKYVDAAGTILIEIQMKRTFLLIQYVIGALAFAEDKKYVFISPRSIKKLFGIGKNARSGTIKAVEGEKKNHSANKKAAIIKATELFPAFMASVSASKKDDISDAILQACWYGHTKLFPPQKTHRKRKKMRTTDVKKTKKSKKQ